MLAVVALVLVVGAPQGPPNGDPSEALPDMLRAGLATLAEMPDRGELDAAREHLAAIVGGDEYAELMESEHAVVLEGLASLDALAGTLGSLEVERQVRSDRVEHLRTRLEENDKALLEAEGNLASTLKSLGDVAGALAIEERVHHAFEQTLPAESADLLDAKLNLAASRYHLGDLEGALELEEYVHSVRERLLPEDHLDLLAAKGNLAATRQMLGDLEGALELSEYVHSARARIHPADHPHLLVAKGNLAMIRKELGNVEGALGLEEEVLEARERTLPEGHPFALSAKQNLTITRLFLGDLEAALSLGEEVLEGWSRLLPAEHPQRLAAQVNLATVRSAMGDTDGALPHFEQVLEGRQRVLPEDHPDVLGAKANVAGVRLRAGDVKGALALYEEVLDTWERQRSEDQVGLFRAKSNVGYALINLGRVDRATKVVEAALDGVRDVLPPGHPTLSRTKSLLADARRLSGDLDGALELYEEIHAVREKLLPMDHPRLLSSKAWLADTRYRLGDVSGAMALVGSLLDAQRIIGSSLRSESPRVARALAQNQLWRLARVLSLRANAPSEEVPASLDASVFTVLETLRAASTASAETALAVARHPDLSPLRDRLARTRREVTDLSDAAPGDPDEIEGWREQLLLRTSERDKLERDLRRELARRGVHSEPPGPERISARLGEDSALVSYYRYERESMDRAENEAERLSLDSMVAFVVAPGGSVTQVDLGAASEIEDLATRWRAAIGRPVSRPRTEASSSGPVATRGIGVGEVASDGEEQGLGNELRSRVLDPCLAALRPERPSTLHLILDDFLHLVPFDALPAAEHHRVGEEIEIRVEVSTRRLEGEQQPRGTAEALLAVGGVDFDADEAAANAPPVFVAMPPGTTSLDRDGTLGRLQPLPETQREIEAIGALHREAFGLDPLLLSSEKASKSALRELAPKARYFHVATHGWFAPETFTSMIDRAVETRDRDAFRRAERDVIGFAPETLCGIALAGANHRSRAAGGGSGIMTAEELRTLPLSQCELAVLSACETNVGVRRAGQGIQSLQAALHAAGARTTITSLWKVDDAATRRLMELFYTKLWTDQLGKAKALWEAKMALRAEGHPIREWAGWVLAGDPH